MTKHTRELVKEQQTNEISNKIEQVPELKVIQSDQNDFFILLNGKTLHL